MKIEKLSNLCDIVIGRTPARKERKYWGKGSKWVSISDLKSKIICETKEEITDYAIEKIRCRKIPKGTLLFSFKLTIGKMAFAGCDLYTNEAIAALVIKDSSLLNSQFLFFALQVVKLVGSNQAAMGKTLNSKSLAELKIPLPSLDDQIRIAHLLSKVEGLIAQRQQNLQQLDDLLKSVFLEMFGDPVRNEMGWEKKPFEKLLSNIESGWSPKCEARPASKNEWGVLKLGAVTGCHYLEEENKALPATLEAKIQHEIKAGDVLFSRKNTSALVADCAYVFETRSKLLMPDLIFRFVIKDTEVVNALYLWKLFVNSSQKRKIQSLAAGAAGSMPNISKTKLKQVLLPIPPIELQNQFATIVEKVKGVKSSYQQSLTELKNLYGALSQKAFKGELDLSKVVVPTEQEKTSQDTKQVEPVVPEKDVNPAIVLSAPADLNSLHSTEGRKVIMNQWLDSYLEQLDGIPFSAEHFMETAQERVWELIKDDVPELGTAVYDQLKKWLFLSLASGRLVQAYDDTGNRVEILSAKG